MKDILLINLVEGLYRVQKITLLTESELQQAYLYFLKIGQVQAVGELKKITGTNPSKRVSIKAQEFVLNEGKVGALKGIQKVTGIKPKFSLKTALNAYNKLNKVKVCHLIKPRIIKEIHDTTGNKATKKIINSWYDTLIKSENITGIRIIENMTGFESKYKLEVDFLLLLRKGYFKEAKKLYEFNKSKLTKKYKDVEGIFKRMKKDKSL